MDTSTVHLELNITWDSTATVEPPEDIPSMYTSWSQAVIVGSLLIIIGILGFFGNLMVFVAVSLSKNLQDTTHVFVVSLAVSDFTTSLALPFQGISVLSETGWPFGSGLCKIFGALLIWTVPTSILTLTAIAVNRYIIITKSKSVQQKIYTRLSVAIIVALLWLFPFLVLVLPQLIPATGGIRYDHGSRICSWDLEHPMLWVFQIISAVAAICCTTIIIFCYVSIIVYVWRHVSARRNRTKVSTDSTNDAETSPAGPSKMQIDITKNLAIVVVTFFVCLLPYSCNLYSYERKIHKTYLYLLLTLSTCLNPMIYAVKHPSFKAVFKCMFYCRFHEVPHPSEWLKNVLHQINVAEITFTETR